ncbi:hypothetical protein Bhyg_05986 [Pseudolycoriella hygida]|uniref:Coiled-coil domain-containing protein 181 n=1 Tax=Pseudolycoriella hygida TaxID=35572 RepID=A0A9Q0S201_9DIPT|nr:hypothetical protein Bhyg_05986 [Pseudolycoriella hygida]
MYQHEESDEDDYEGYFLKPVNGYNIADRIKSANKELFEGDSSVQSGDFTETLRRVSFRPEPDYEPSEAELDEASSCDEEDIAVINQVLDKREEIVVFEELEVEIKGTENHKQTRMSNGDSATADEDIEEICEEINNVDISASDESQIPNEKEESCDVVEPVEQTQLLDNEDVVSSRVTDDLSNLKNEINRKPNLKFTSVKPTNHHHHHHNNRPNSSVHTKKSSESQFLKIQLNFKPCCEYKYLENERLPRYCGYISQYGLSKEQLEMKEKRKERLKERQSDRTAKQLQEEALKSEVNEEAFARWLQNKMRNSRSMTRNMYDYRPTKQKKGKKKV